MPFGVIDRPAIIQNLLDAGCTQEQIDQFLGYLDAGKKQEQFRLLTQQRGCLLDRVHAGQKQLDCLDFLVYSLKKTYQQQQEENSK